MDSTITNKNRRNGEIVEPMPRDYAPYRPGPFRLAMDLHPLDLADWIEIDTHLPAQLAEKRRLLAERHAAVFAALPQAAAGAQETLALLVEHLPAHFPQVYERQGDYLANHATGERWSLAGSSLHPLELAGRLVQEDLCLMGHNSETGLYHLTGACLCFPSRWRLAKKLGRPLGAIHAPVPGYDAVLEEPMNRLFARLRAHKPVWRMNWSVVDDPALFQPTPPQETETTAPVTADDAGERLWVRMERQTLRRLPHSQDILFTIRIYTHPLARLAQQPERAARLAEALRGLDGPMRRYKGLDHHLEAAVAWLEEQIRAFHRKNS